MQSDTIRQDYFLSVPGDVSADGFDSFFVSGLESFLESDWVSGLVPGLDSDLVTEFDSGFAPELEDVFDFL
jgi:hypothetical protein